MKNTYVLLLLCLGIVIIGCADNPHTGSMLSPGDVKKYITRSEDGTICLQANTDSACFTLTPDRNVDANGMKMPVIHVYPQKLVYIFYHEGEPILRAERTTDTQAIVQRLTPQTRSRQSPRTLTPDNNAGNVDTTPPLNPTGPNINPQAGETGVDDADKDGWVIQVYYDAPQTVSTLAGSGLRIRIDGNRVTDAEISGFKRTETDDGTAIEFFYPMDTQDASAIDIQIGGLVGAGEVVKFSVNPP